MRKITFFLFLFLAINLFNFASSNVCCFYPSNGMCSERVPSDVCTENSGIVVGSSCSSSAECSMGCCILGIGVRYTTQRQCELESLSAGFRTDWRSMSENQCSNLASSSVLGACVYNYDFCSYTKKENCRGTDKIFYESKLCSDPTLKTRCSKTDRTKCFEDGNIYFVDSCGNRDSLVQECKYSEGFICVQNGSKKAICKNLNCIDSSGKTRKNGESWCIGLAGGFLYDEQALKESGSQKETFYWKLYSDHPGGVYMGRRVTVRWPTKLYTQYGATCSNTKVVARGVVFGDCRIDKDGGNARLSYSTDKSPSSFGSNFEVQIYKNNQLLASVVVPNGGSAFRTEKINIKGSPQQMSSPFKYGNRKVNSSTGVLQILTQDIREVQFGTPDGKPSEFFDAVGSRFFRQVCIDGEIVTEPCDDYRNEVCVPDVNNSGAKCIANNWDVCLDANLAEPDPVTGSIVDEEACDPEWCYLYRGIEPVSEILKDLNIELCLPKVSGGQAISSKISSGKKSDSGICSYGDYNAETKFKEGTKTKKITNSGISRIKLYDWRAYADIDGTWGKVGLISLVPEHWGFGDYQNIYCLEGNPLYQKDRTKLSWKKFGTWIDVILGGSISVGCGIVTSMLSGSPTAGLAAGAGCFALYFKDIYKYAVDFNRFPPMVSVEYGHCGKIKTATSWPVEPKVIELLNQRAVGIGDCAENLNWVGASGTSFNVGDTLYCKGSNGEKVCSFSFTPKKWSPPNRGNCSLCGADGLPCSEYRCKSIGRNCEYKEPRGIDSGVCVSSNDLSGPVISISQNPANPIPPYSAVKITITTNEDSYCKFDFKSGGVNIDNMRYETDRAFGRAHEFILTAPRAAINDEDIEAYPFLTRDGKYEVFIMCEDGAGNVNQKVQNLEVMKTPDEIPPSILEFFPPSNSFVKFNTTTKRIRFRLNEPAECRWGFDGGKAYGEMGLARVINEEGEEEIISQNDFACDTSINEETTAKGYWCEGELRNITTVVGNSTKFYIKCKDQPWLEGKENQYYKRNENQRAFEYVLRPSMALEIVDFSPKGEYITGSDKQNLSIQLKTASGLERGKSECKWKIKVNNISSAWKFFNRTNSTTHTDAILNLVEGDYEISVQCEDAAGNLAQDKYNLKVIIDKGPPKLLRVYNDKGNLKVVLSEKATSCKFLNSLGCAFVAQNGTSMSKIKDNEFATGLKKGQLYYIRCEDVFGNSACYNEIFVH